MWWDAVVLETLIISYNERQVKTFKFLPMKWVQAHAELSKQFNDWAIAQFGKTIFNSSENFFKIRC